MSDPQPTAAEIVEDAILSRRSVRAFLPTPVPRELIEHILDVAARAPSGTNMQPWRAYVLAGEVKERLSQPLVRAHVEGAPHRSEYKYYPDQFFEPYLSRRRRVGWDLYGLLGIARGETARMQAHHARNFLFFDAPAGLIFTIDRRLEIGSWLDYGIFLGNVMTAVRGHGLHSCAQAAFAPMHEIVRQHLPIPPEEVVVCGMSIGYEDTGAAENRLRTERIPAREFATFLGWP